MIFHDQTPDTTMEEDLSVTEAAPRVTKPAVKPTPAPTTDNVDASQRTEVEPREEGKVPPAFLKNIKGKKDDDDEDDDKKDEAIDPAHVIDVDALDEEDMKGLADALSAYSQELGLDEDEYNEMLEDDEFIADFATGFFGEATEPLDPKSEAAYEVLEAFYGQIDALQEGDDEAQPGYDELVGVVEAYEYLHEIATRVLGGKIIRGRQARSAGAAQQCRAANPGKKCVKVGRRYVARGAVSGRKKAKSRLSGRKAHRGAGTAHMKKSLRRSGAAKARRRGVRSDVEIDSGANLSELEQNLADLRQTVSEAEIEEAVEIASNELLEGLKAVYDASTDWYEKIANEVKESENVEDDDARVAMGRHLEGIAEDAARVAQLIAEGEASIEDAADDLEALGADLDDALEAMKGID
jgi:hypothetical protein